MKNGQRCDHWGEMGRRACARSHQMAVQNELNSHEAYARAHLRPFFSHIYTHTSDIRRPWADFNALFRPNRLKIYLETEKM